MLLACTELDYYELSKGNSDQSKYPKMILKKTCGYYYLLWW